jgi:hypothetical protein
MAQQGFVAVMMRLISRRAIIYERFQPVYFSLGFVAEIHRHFPRPTIVLIAVSELLATRGERPGAFLLRICLSVSGNFFGVLFFPGSVSDGICLPPFKYLVPCYTIHSFSLSRQDHIATQTKPI